ncbi:MAG: hypothetical protein RRA15_13485 [bacterium]|nr:hypothetical protein [bacterium]MDT8367471.1 hypothetical protein [bacterium]
MRILNTSVIVLCFTQILLGFSFAQAAPPDWRGNSSQPGPTANSPVTPTPQRFDLQCPSAYSGIKGELLPTYWEAIDKGQQARLIKSQVQDQYLFCVYQVPSSGREIHSSVRRLIPKGYNCVSDGAGRFECKQVNAPNSPVR